MVESENDMAQEFWPQDTATEMYLASTYDLKEILERIQKKWPGATPEQITIDTDRFQTKCIGYDLYDPSDYTTFIVIRRIEA